MGVDILNRFSLVNEKAEKYAIEECQFVTILQPI